MPSTTTRPEVAESTPPPRMCRSVDLPEFPRGAHDGNELASTHGERGTVERPPLRCPLAKDAHDVLDDDRRVGVVCGDGHRLRDVGRGGAVERDVERDAPLAVHLLGEERERGGHAHAQVVADALHGALGLLVEPEVDERGPRHSRLLKDSIFILSYDAGDLNWHLVPHSALAFSRALPV